MTENNVSLNDFLDEPELTIPDVPPEPEPEKMTQNNFMNTIMKNLHKLTPDERSQIMKYFQEQQSQEDPKQRLKDKLALKRNMRTKKQIVMKKIDQDDKKQEMIQEIMKKLNIKI
jgi:uncharacterized membrane protein